jgi:2-methylcitrate dehydratase PrpD
MIGAVQDARAALAADPLSIGRVEIEAPMETMHPLRVLDPKSGNEGKFCAAYIVAVALAQGHVGLADFTNDAVHRPDMRALMARIRITDDARSGRAAVGLEHGRIVVRLTQGDRRAEGTCAAFPGSPDSPPSPQALDAKIADCARLYAAATGRALTAAEIRRKVAALTSHELLEITA